MITKSREHLWWNSAALLKFLKGVITRSHDRIVIKIIKLTVKTLTLEKLWSQNHKIMSDKKVLPPWNFWEAWSQDHMITRSHDHIVIKIKKLTVKTLTLEKLWSQNHKITCDKIVLPSQNFWKAWSQDHMIALWSKSTNWLLKLWH